MLCFESFCEWKIPTGARLDVWQMKAVVFESDVKVETKSWRLLPSDHGLDFKWKAIHVASPQFLKVSQVSSIPATSGNVR